MGKRTHEFEMVVLSHADDDHLVLIDSRVEPVVSGAFHLLFTGPATHPDQVAQWMRSTNIRSENRLHVVKVDDMEAPQVSQLLGRVCFALGRDGSRGSIIDAYLVGDRLFVRGPKHRMLHIPLDSIRALRGQPQAAVRNFSIDPDGSFIYWPDLDVHLGWNQFLQAVDPAELRKAQQRSAGFNERYGAAIRRVREAAGILQSKVEGLTERQAPPHRAGGEPGHDCGDHRTGKGSRPRRERLHGEADKGDAVSKRFCRAKMKGAGAAYRAYHASLTRLGEERENCDQFRELFRPGFAGRFAHGTWEEIDDLWAAPVPQLARLHRYLETKTAGLVAAFRLRQVCES